MGLCTWSVPEHSTTLSQLDKRHQQLKCTMPLTASSGSTQERGPAICPLRLPLLSYPAITGTAAAARGGICTEGSQGMTHLTDCSDKLDDQLGMKGMLLITMLPWQTIFNWP